MKKTFLAALALCTGIAALALGLPGTGAKYVSSVTVPYTVTTEPTSWYFGYTGGGQSLAIPQNGYYAIQLWGAEGGLGSARSFTGTGGETSGGKGAYLTGVFEFYEGETLTVQVGGRGGNGTGTMDGTGILYPGNGGYNGGGGGAGFYDVANDSTLSYPQSGGGGGGATDIRLNSNDPASRVMAAGGGGGGGGGSMRMIASNGGDGGSGTVGAANIDGVNGHFLPGGDASKQATFTEGIAGLGGFATGGTADMGGGGGGGGYNGGDGAAGIGGGGGGSSFISADTGWQASAALATQLPGPDDSLAVYTDGYGYAIITYLGTVTPDTSQDAPTTSPGARGGTALGSG